MNKPLVIYHGGCRDGFCAAWVVHRKFPEADFVEGYYGKAPPDVTGREVIMVDFSYPRDVLSTMASSAASVVVLDHHKTAQAALQGFAEEHENTVIVFDMERSGAGLAWDYFFDEPRPWVVDYVEDRDLWRHRLPESKTVNAWLSILPFDFIQWTMAAQAQLAVAIEGGAAVELKTAQYVREVSKNAYMVTTPEGLHVMVCNAPQVDISELLDALATTHPEAPYVIGWFKRSDGVFQYSLRSRPGPNGEPAYDVSEVAKKAGGGGHRQAAGFQSANLLF